MFTVLLPGPGLWVPPLPPTGCWCPCASRHWLKSESGRFISWLKLHFGNFGHFCGCWDVNCLSMLLPLVYLPVLLLCFWLAWFWFLTQINLFDPCFYTFCYNAHRTLVGESCRFLLIFTLFSCFSLIDRKVCNPFVRLSYSVDGVSF